LWAGIAGVTVWRCVWVARTELLPEEAYYWTYAQHPALGYFDHPPLVACTVALGTMVWGNTEWGVRFVNLLLWIGTVVVVALTGRVWFGERAGAVAGLVWASLPGMLGIGFVVTPDGPLLCFWALTMYAVSRALATERRRYWWGAGVAWGGALLAKYYAVVLGPSLLLFLVLTPRYRHWLRRWEPWAAVGVALAVFSPVIWWNEQHQWASFLFQSTRTAGGPKGRTWFHVAEFWILQVVVLTPVGFALLAAAGWQAVRRGWWRGQANWSFVAAFGLPVFGLFAAASFQTDVHVNWTAPAFLALAMGGAALWTEVMDAPPTGRQRWWRRLTWVGVVLVGLAFGVGHWTLATGRPRVFAYSRSGGWKKLAARVEARAMELEAQTGQRPFIVGADKYNIAAELGFYLQRSAECVNLYATGEHGLGYRYWTDLREFAGRPAVIVILSMKPALMKGLAQSFERLDEPERTAVGTHGKRWRNVHIITGYRYRPPGEVALD
jgi:dolichol-phosphate mannosyltransferase